MRIILTFFKDIDDIRHSFREFARLLPADGMLIINADTPKYDYVTEGLGCQNCHLRAGESGCR